MLSARIPLSTTASLLVVPAATVLTSPPAAAVGPADLPACRHFSSGPIPDRPPSPGHGPATEITPVDRSGRLRAPTGGTGQLNANGTVSFPVKRVPGAVAHPAFRNGQSAQRTFVVE
jgi:hypothetical protein